MLKSNLAINGWRALTQGAKNIGYNLSDTWHAEAPLTYALRTRKARQAYQNSVQEYGAKKAMELHKENGWGPGTFNYKRAAILGGAAYVATDGLYRMLSGGSIYRNKSGEQDFVGIPFI